MKKKKNNNSCVHLPSLLKQIGKRDVRFIVAVANPPRFFQKGVGGCSLVKKASINKQTVEFALILTNILLKRSLNTKSAVSH